MKVTFNSKDINNKRKSIFPILITTTLVGSITIVSYFFYNKATSQSNNTYKNSQPSHIISEGDHKETVDLKENKPNEFELRLLDEWLGQIPPEVKETEWLIVVDRSEQKDYVFKNRQFIESYTISTGSATRYDYDATLPIGIWQVTTKIDSGLADLYGPRLMYLEWWNGETFEKTQKALHGTNEPENLGQATSMGCVYHANEDILELYEWIPSGTIVITVE